MPIDRDGAGRRWQPSTGGTDTQTDAGPNRVLTTGAQRCGWMSRQRAVPWQGSADKGLKAGLSYGLSLRSSTTSSLHPLVALQGQGRFFRGCGRCGFIYFF